MRCIPRGEGNGEPPLVSDPCCGTDVLLMEAGKLHPLAELIGQDVDARCARITAINFGLRGKYGWVICGNSLSRDVQFVYRVGGFFHEAPNGRRRGVIREVSPSEYPVLPELQGRAGPDLLANASEQSQTNQRCPIVEIPEWALRLEQRLAAIEEDEAGEKQTASNSVAPPAPENVDSNEPSQAKTQKRLF